jgi:transposase
VHARLRPDESYRLWYRCHVQAHRLKRILFVRLWPRPSAHTSSCTTNAHAFRANSPKAETDPKNQTNTCTGTFTNTCTGAQTYTCTGT